MSVLDNRPDLFYTDETRGVSCAQRALRAYILCTAEEQGGTIAAFLALPAHPNHMPATPGDPAPWNGRALQPSIEIEEAI